MAHHRCVSYNSHSVFPAEAIATCTHADLSCTDVKPLSAVFEAQAGLSCAKSTAADSMHSSQDVTCRADAVI